MANLASIISSPLKTSTLATADFYVDMSNDFDISSMYTFSMKSWDINSIIPYPVAVVDIEKVDDTLTNKGLW